MTLPDAARLFRSLAVGVVGGALFQWLGLPLPWVMGAMAATIVAGAAGWPGRMPRSVRNAVIPALGVTFGSAIDRDAVTYLPQLWLLAPLTAAYLAAIIACGCLYFGRLAGMDLATAYFASVPGSFSEMLFVAEERKADLAQVAIVHSMRQVVALSTITLAFRYWLGIDTTVLPDLGGGGLAPRDVVVLVACGVLGVVAGRAVHLPSAHLFGPLLLSAAAHLGGLVAGAPPPWMVGLVQVFIGVFIGLRFAGVSLRSALPLIALSAGWAAILLLFAVVTAEIAVLAVGLPFEAAFLAFAPGGAVEISVVALAAGVSLSIITTIQLVRIGLTVLLVPAAFGPLGRLRIFVDRGR